jgi:multidrug efflux pump subunit AcrB
LRQINLDSAGGRAEIAGSEQAVRVLGNAETASELANTQIALPGGRTARLGNLAQVIDSNSEQRSISKLNGRQIVSFGVTRAKGASDVTVYNNIVKELEKIEQESEGTINFDEIYTEVESIVLQYESSIEMLWEGALLAVLVVFVFLRDWRATLISAVAIPALGYSHFWFLDLMGFTLNFLSLLALSLVAGVLVMTRSWRSRISSVTCGWANRPIRHRSTLPTKSVSPCSRPQWQSSPSSFPSA